MLRARVVLLVLLAAAACGAAALATLAADAQGAARSPGAAAADGLPLLALSRSGGSVFLRRRDPVTLQPLGTGLRLGSAGWDLCRSADGALRVFASADVAELRLVRVRPLRLLRAVALPYSRPEGCSVAADGTVSVLLLAVSVELHRIPAGGEDALVRELPGYETAGDPVSAGGRLVALLAPQGRIGTAKLLVVEADGSSHVLALPGLRAGMRDPGAKDVRLLQAQPALAASPDGSRVAVLPERGPVAEVDLATRAVSWHDVGAPRSTARAEKALDGYVRVAAWLPSGQIAVTGARWRTTGSGDRIDVERVPAGLALVDTRTWTSRLLDPAAVELHAGSFGVAAVTRDPKTSASAVAVYSAEGRLRFRRPPSPYLEQVVVAGPRVYLAAADGTAWTVLDGRTGRAGPEHVLEATIDPLG